MKDTNLEWRIRIRMMDKNWEWRIRLKKDRWEKKMKDKSKNEEEE